MDKDDIKISEIIGILSSLFFVLTIIYVYGYSKSIGVQVLKYFTLNDYLNYSINWLTPILLFLFVGLIFHLITRRVEHGKSEEEIIASSSNPKFTKRFRKIANYLMWASMILIGLSSYFFYLLNKISEERLYSDLKIAIPISWIIFSYWYIKVPRLIKDWRKKHILLFTFIPAIIMSSFFAGLHDGEKALNNKYENEIQKVLYNNKKEISGNIIFMLSNYTILIKKGSNKIISIPNSEIKIIKQ